MKKTKALVITDPKKELSEIICAPPGCGRGPSNIHPALIGNDANSLFALNPFAVVSVSVPEDQAKRWNRFTRMVYADLLSAAQEQEAAPNAGTTENSD